MQLVVVHFHLFGIFSNLILVVVVVVVVVIHPLPLFPVLFLLRGGICITKHTKSNKMQTNEHPTGGGPGGYVAAIKAAQMGMKTACVEMRGRLGGTCLNVGCIPSKALLTSSHHYHDAKTHFADHGIVINGLSMDIGKMQDTKSKSVEGLTGGIEYLFKKHGVTYYKGKGKLTGPNAVGVTLNDGGTETLDSKHIVIATGSEVTPLPPVPVDNAGGKIVDSTGALKISAVPAKMAVIGGGVIGLEMGSVWARLGSEVTVIEFLDRILPSMDTEVTKKFQTILKKQGFKFKLKTKVVKSDVTADGVVLTTEASKGGDPQEEAYDVVLVATGRRPYTAGLGLEDLGIQTDRLGRIEVDAHFKTAVPSIYAIGDAITGPMLAHKAEEEGIAAIETIAGYAGHVNYDAIPGKSSLSLLMLLVEGGGEIHPPWFVIESTMSMVLTVLSMSFFDTV
jgi:dihydrolipoamide dehydrogenase